MEYLDLGSLYGEHWAVAKILESLLQLIYRRCCEESYNFAWCKRKNDNYYRYLSGTTLKLLFMNPYPVWQNVTGNALSA